MKIKKRDGKIVDFDVNKIKIAMEKAFNSVDEKIDEEKLFEMAKNIENNIRESLIKGHIITVEEVQDLVELALIDANFYKVVKSFILYRAKHTKSRKVIEDFEKYIKDEDTISILRDIQKKYKGLNYDIELIYNKFISFVKNDMTEDEYLDILTKASSELTSKEAPDFEYISSKFLRKRVQNDIDRKCNQLEIFSYLDKFNYFVKASLYGKYMKEEYSEKEIIELGEYIDNKRDDLLTFSSLDLIVKRYAVKDNFGHILETPQEMFMGIAMHLAIPEKEKKVEFAKRLYDILSKLKLTMATPTMSNARRPFHQLSSCFIDTVPDSLDGIYRSIDNFAQVSKHGGGMGLYMGKIRATGSDRSEEDKDESLRS